MSGVAFTQPYSMRTFGKDVCLRGDSGLDERFIEPQPLFNRNHVIREGTKPKCRWRFFGHELVTNNLSIPRLIKIPFFMRMRTAFQRVPR